MLHVNHRPRDFDEVVGNSSTVSSLSSMFSREREKIPHTFLLTGPSGCGKTTIARIIRRKLGCSKADYFEINSADFRGIDMVRDIIQRMHYQPSKGEVRVWLIDECHQLSKDAQHAFLKALEEPPPHVYFILATTEPEKLLPTIRNRCSRFAVERASEKALAKLIQRVCEENGVEIGDAVKNAVIGKADGCPRACLLMLDSVIGMDEPSQLKAVKKWEEAQAEVIELCRLLINRAGWSSIAPVVKNLKEEPESVRRAVLGYASSCMLNNSVSAFAVMEAFEAPLYDIGKPGLVMACFRASQKRG